MTGETVREDSGQGTPAGQGLRAFLANRDVPCPNCGVNLRGTDGESCPSCGENLSMEMVRRGWGARRPMFLSVCTAGVSILGGMTFLALLGSFSSVIPSHGGLTQLALLAALVGEFLLVWLLVNEPNDTFERSRRPGVLWALIALIAFGGISVAVGVALFAVHTIIRIVL